MKINQINLNSNTATNFQAACRIHSVNLNGRHYDSKNQDTVYRVAKILSAGMFSNRLSAKVASKMNNLCKDFQDMPYVTVARTPEAIYKQKIILLTAEDARKYRNLCDADETYEAKAAFLYGALERDGNKKITVNAVGNDKNIVITDIKERQ